MPPRVMPQDDGIHSSPTLSGPVIEGIAGFTAGVVTTLSVHPFDVVKTRLQVDQSSRNSWGTSTRIVRNILQNEGGVGALYRGLMPNLVGNSLSWALYFLWYRSLKDMIQTYRGGGGKGTTLTSLDYFLASGGSGILTAVLTNPIWVIKTRMLSTGRNAPGAYTSTTHGVRDIWRTEGLPGFYRGLVPSLFGVSHGAVQFMVYEQLKNYRGRSTRGGKEGLGNLDYLWLSAVSKAIAGSVTYPYQVVRARLQTYDADLKYRGASDAVVQIWRREGLSGFYKGLGPNILRVLPSTCVTFLVYENTKFYLNRSYGASAEAKLG